LATENIKTAAEVIAEFLDAQSKEKALDACTVAAVITLRKDDDLSKIKLLRKLEEARKTALTADAASAEEAGDD
jgi:hypothetical protein